MLEQLWHWIETTIIAMGYPGIILLVAVEVIIPPLPSEVVLPLAGALASTGALSLPLVILAATIGSVIGASTLYALARWGRQAVVLRLVHRYGALLSVSEQDLDAADRYFRKRGHLAVLVGRVIPLVRSLVSLPAGHARMPIAPFLLLTAIGSLAWNSLLVGGGYLLGESWELVGGWVKQFEILTVAVLGVLFLAGLVAIYLRAKRIREQEAEA